MTFLRGGQKCFLYTLVKVQRGVDKWLSKLHNRELEILLKVPLNLRGEYLAESCIVKLVDGEGIEMPGEP